MDFWALSHLHGRIIPNPPVPREYLATIFMSAFPDFSVSKFLFISIEPCDPDQMENVPVSLTITYHVHLSVS